MLASGGGLLGCRLLEPLLTKLPKALVAALGVACFLVLLPAALSRGRTSRSRPMAIVGVALAVLASMALRAFGDGLDLARALAPGE